MGKGSSKSKAQEGAKSADSKTPQQVQRGLAGNTFGLKFRLTQARDIERVRRSGRRIQASVLSVWIARGSTLQPRVAIVVRLHRHSAVARNRLKRQLRYIMRTEILPRATEPYDAVMTVKASAYSATFDMLRSLVVQVFTT
jgi:ribonuclease P protein component